MVAVDLYDDPMAQFLLSILALVLQKPKFFCFVLDVDSLKIYIFFF